MRHFKILSTVAVAAVALTAFVGAGTAAGQTEIYLAHATKTAGTTINASLKVGGTALLTDTEGGATDTCKKSNVAATTTNTTANEVEGNITVLEFSECTWASPTLEKGKLDITYIGDFNGDGQGDGTLTGTANLVTVKAFNLVTCLYGTASGAHIGKVLSSTAGHALIDIRGAILEQGEKKALCPDTTIWDAEYTVTTTGLNFAE